MDARSVATEISRFSLTQHLQTSARPTLSSFRPPALSIDDVVERNAPVVPWLRRWHKRGAAIASVCSGVGLVAATGLLDGKRATTHWGLAERFREKYPEVKWMPELMVTEDHGFYCGGGVNASLDLSLYLVERFCGHEVAMQSAKALLIETPRAWQAGFAIVPLKTEHSDDSISSAQEWLHQNFHQTFPLEAPARRVGMSLRNFVRRFKQATGDSPLIYLQKLGWLPPSACWKATIAPCRKSATPSAIRMLPFSADSSSATPASPPAPTAEGSERSARWKMHSWGREPSPAWPNQARQDFMKLTGHLDLFFDKLPPRMSHSSV